MQIIRAGEDLTSAVRNLRQDDASLALVPTMGALHAGHMALIAEARKRAERVAATIFVNPLQFNDTADLKRYPRTEDDDVEKLEEAGCDLVWIPGAADIYPDGFATTVSVAGISERWEGEARPGHFDGVATVVARLLLTVRPDLALFGEKDFQQLAVIRQMVADLAIGVEIVAVPTVRDSGGLARSSRNALLSPGERQSALALPQALAEARDQILAGQAVESALRDGEQRLEDAGFAKIDYFALVDAITLEPLSEPGGAMRLIAAATIGSTRLIDNLAVEFAPQS